MCGRFVQATNRYLLALLEQQQETIHASYNVAPGQPIYAVKNDKSQSTIAKSYVWGFKPFESKSSGKIPQPINARKESLLEAKPFYKKAFHENRIVIPADGFYEWQQVGKMKIPHYLYNEQGCLFAGLAAESTGTCLIITTEASPQVREIHERMPVCLNPDEVSLWLNPKSDQNSLFDLLNSKTETKFNIYPVSKRVNRPSENDSGLIIETGENSETKQDLLI